ncbi:MULTISPECIES: hypothetical protein [unclassified Shewanella]|uniref:hypothetical protein n=1 Tax=unclassified Shewanella TaxID=196818 RepID=UPI001BC531B1|nr:MULTISPECIES: hypothetical protein [unclassified Shewanella]GIU16981.1 hypothetical protein TUM4444_30290 [Shewanella sp. MBTL60-112-B1]GIU38725.1 hypothetical protein TUM4445_33310 [Shewanella sp. MBTL60-112-B2]
MKTNDLSKSRYYFSGSVIMFLGLIYNLIEKDLLGSFSFLLLSVISLSLGVINKRAATAKE